MNRWVAPIVGFGVPFAVIGALYWPLSYQDAQMPSGLPALGLLLVGLAAMMLRAATDTPWWAAWAFPAAAVPAANLVRVMVDTSSDPTSHNLWPLEIAIAVFVGGFISALGFAVGQLVRRASRRPPPSAV